MRKKFHSIISYAILGIHSFFSFLRYLANNRASSLINVSMVCRFPTFIRAISTYDSKYLFNLAVNIFVIYLLLHYIQSFNNINLSYYILTNQYI